MGDRRGEGSDLPAEYVDPWRLLWRDLGAVLAWSRLRLWELGRRNRGGELWRPGVWPRSLAPLFWPLVLAVLLLVAAAGGMALRAQRLKGSPAPPTAAVREEPTLREEAAEVQPEEVQSEEVQPDPEQTQEERPKETQKETQRVSPEPGPPSPPEAMSPPPPPAVPVPDPLLSALGERGESGEPALLRAARPVPAQGLLVLQATAAYAARPAAERRERAEAWERQGRELGYERLEVRDGQGRLLVRSALVGGGLVLFEPSSGDAGADPA